MALLPLLGALLTTALAPASASSGCRPSRITDTDDAGCGRFLPRFHPKNTQPLAHNNDANAPFEYKGTTHLFMQASFPGVPGWTEGAIGLGHVASRDFATWVEAGPALVPGTWGGPIGGVGQPAGNATGGYYSGSATLVDGEPRIIIPAVFFHMAAQTECPIKCEDRDPWHCMMNRTWAEECAMVYTTSSPTNLSDPLLSSWSEPITIADGRVDGVQPHSPSFDDTTHAWQDPEDLAAGRQTWRFAGQTTVCKTNTCNNHAAGDRPTYLQLFASKNGSDWSAGFDALGDLFPYEPDNEPDAGIMNVPDFWKKEETHWPLDFVHFGSDAYWLGNYQRNGSGFGETAFVPVTPQQQFGPGPAEGHGYYSDMAKSFVWFGWINGHPPPEPGVPTWDSCLSIARAATFDPGLSTVGDFHGMVTFNPLPSLATLHAKLLVDEADAWRSAPAGVLPLPHGAGNCLDIELNITWPNGAVVPADFGSVGVSVLGSPAGPIDLRGDAGSEEPTGGFDAAEHGAGVTVSETDSGSLASWGPAEPGVHPTPNCNQLAFLNASASYSVRLGKNMGAWQDIGWCSRSLSFSGSSWIGPSPQWLGYQAVGKAFVYRNNLGQRAGLFKASRPKPAASPDQGTPYGVAYKAGDNITAIRWPVSAGQPHERLEYRVNGKSQGMITLPHPMPADAVGCISTCGGGEIATGSAVIPPAPPAPPAPHPRPHPAAGTELLISSGSAGAFSLNNVPLAPSKSSRPRPDTLSLRVLVDRSVVEAFAQGGRATWAGMKFPAKTQTATALVWRPPVGIAEGAARPTFSVRVWSMKTGFSETLGTDVTVQ